ADLLSAAIDVVPQAAFETVVGLAIYLVRGDDVAGPAESIRRERRPVGFRRLEVTAQGRRPTEAQFAHLPLADRRLGFRRQDPDLVEWAPRGSIGAVAYLFGR